MAEITAQLVKQLRERTGAGMMECKKRPGRGRRRPRRSRSRAAQARHRVGQQEGLAHHQAGPDRHVTFTPARSSACWWKSTANPISWRAPTISRNWCTISPCTSPRPIRSSSARKTSPRRRSKRSATSSAPARRRRQAREMWSTRSSKAAWQILRRGLPARAALRQGSHHHRRPADQDQDRQAGREYHRVAVCPLQGGR